MEKPWLCHTYCEWGRGWSPGYGPWSRAGITDLHVMPRAAHWLQRPFGYALLAHPSSRWGLGGPAESSHCCNTTQLRAQVPQYPDNEPGWQTFIVEASLEEGMKVMPCVVLGHPVLWIHTGSRSQTTQSPRVSGTARSEYSLAI